MSIKEKVHCYLRLLENEGFCCAFIDKKTQDGVINEIERQSQSQLIKIDIKNDIHKNSYREDEPFGWYEIFQRKLFSNRTELTDEATQIRKSYSKENLKDFMVRSFQLLSNKKIIVVLNNIESILDENYSKLKPSEVYHFFDAISTEIKKYKDNRLQFLIFGFPVKDSLDPQSNPLDVYNILINQNKVKHSNANQTISTHQVVDQKTDSDSGSPKPEQVGTRIEHGDERKNDRKKVWFHVIELPWLRSLFFSSEETNEFQKSFLLIILIFPIAALVGLVTWWFSTFVPIPEPTPISTQEPTPIPTQEPTPIPTQEPTPIPTQEPTPIPTQEPTPIPTQEPTTIPTQEPTPIPTQEPTPIPTQEPTLIPPQEPTPIPDLPPCSKSQIFAPCDPNQ